MRAAGAPAGPIRTIAEACESPEVMERERFVTVPHPTAGTVPCLRSPIRLDGTPVRAPVAAPILGQHTAAALGDWLGYAAATIDPPKDPRRDRGAQRTRDHSPTHSPTPPRPTSPPSPP